MKKWIVAAAAAGMSVLFSVTPFAAGWELGTGEHASQWRYVNADNTVDTGWHVIDGNGDGIAEWYYFDQEELLPWDRLYVTWFTDKKEALAELRYLKKEQPRT